MIMKLGDSNPLSYYYIFKGNAKEEDYPEEACTPWYHQTAQIDGLKINSPGITGPGVLVEQAAGITLTTMILDRLRHVCLDWCYYRGEVTAGGPETITVT